MKRTPILFSAPMVLAILAGRKTQTRRVADLRYLVQTAPPNIVYSQPGHEPYAVGDVLWVKEAIRFDGSDIINDRCEERDFAVFVADGAPTKLDHWPWKRDYLPGMFMPYGLRRIELEVKAVRYERLQDISEADAIAEGVSSLPAVNEAAGRDDGPREFFASLWDNINATRAPWAANPIVRVTTFERVS